MTAKDDFEIGALIFDPGSGELSKPARARRLEPKAAAVLKVLCEGRGTVVPRQELLDRCWGQGEGSDEALTQTIAQIRRALDDLGENAGLIETFARRGYRLQPKHEMHVVPAASLHDTKPVRQRRRFGLALVAALVVLFLATWVAFPHGARHFVRHSLGLGPNAAQH